MKKIKIVAVLFQIMLFLALVACPETITAQTYHTNKKKAVNAYKKARKAYIKKDYNKAMRLVDKSLHSDARFVEALQLKGGIGMQTGDFDMAARSYERSLAADSTAFPWNAVVLGDFYMDKGNYDDAIKILKWYVNLKNKKEEKHKIASKLLADAEFRMYAVNNPVSFEPKNLGANVNTDGDEYINQVTPDNGRIYFTRRLQEKDSEGFRVEEVFYSSIVDSGYLEAIPMNLEWNNNKRMGAVCLSADKKSMYFVGFDWLDSKGRGDIYVSKSDGKAWGKPENLGNVVNTPTVESQPCISSDGTELYFTRYSRINESTDIYVSKIFNGVWTNPQAISIINTPGNEMAPFIHPDGKTLYFASDGLPGMGGYDIFMSRRDDKGEWGKPVNLGYPINTKGDELTFAVSINGETAYISSIREDGFGGYDIYEFNLDKNIVPQQIADQQRFVLHNIKFELNSDVLDPTSYSVIADMASYLNNNKKVKVEISGYTDNSGNENSNVSLSERRAIAVMNALVNMGVNKKRIVAKGFGESNPVAPNDTEQGRALNRRVEMRIL